MKEGRALQSSQRAAQFCLQLNRQQAIPHSLHIKVCRPPHPQCMECGFGHVALGYPSPTDFEPAVRPFQIPREKTQAFQPCRYKSSVPLNTELLDRAGYGPTLSGSCFTPLLISSRRCLSSRRVLYPPRTKRRLNYGPSTSGYAGSSA
jgi:hypothetical protein